MQLGPPDVSGGLSSDLRNVSGGLKELTLGAPDVSRTSRCVSDLQMCLGSPDVSRTSKYVSDLQMCLGSPDVSRISRCVSELQMCLGPPDVSRTSRSVSVTSMLMKFVFQGCPRQWGRSSGSIKLKDVFWGGLLWLLGWFGDSFWVVVGVVLGGCVRVG